MTQNLFAHPDHDDAHTRLLQLQQDSNRLILVEFVSPYCPTCKMLSLLLQALMQEWASSDLAPEGEGYSSRGLRMT